VGERHGLQFSLRTLLIVVTVSAAFLCWVSWKLEQARKERAVIAWIETMGGSVQFGGWVDSGFGMGVAHVNLTNPQVSDLSPLVGLKSLEVLNLRNTQVSDLSPLAELKNLEGLYLDKSPVSDLAPLAGLHDLRTLSLHGTRVSDLAPLAKLKSLEDFDVRDTPLSDRAAEAFRKAQPNCRLER